MDYVKLFLDYLKDVRGLSANTLIAYKGDLNKFFVNKIDPDKVTKLHVQMFVVQQKAEKQAPRSINRRLDCLSTFYSYLRDELELPIPNPVRREYRQKIKDKTAGRRHRVFPEQATKLMQIIKPIDDVAYVSMMLMGKQGLRINEVRTLKIEDIDFVRNKMLIRGSKGDDREIPLVGSVKEALLEYLGLRQMGPVLLSTESGGGPYKSNVAIWKRVRFYMDRYGLEGTPHSWRKMYGTEVYRKTKDIVLVQTLLGHKSVETTRASYVDDADLNEDIRTKIEEIF